MYNKNSACYLSILLQNIHLVARWLPKLEKLLEHYGEGSNANYRVYMSAEPAADVSGHIIPQGVLESSIKITNEPPTGMIANLHKALDNFNQVLLAATTSLSFCFTSSFSTTKGYS